MNVQQIWLCLGIVALFSSPKAEGAVDCLQCKGVSEPHDCQTIVTCAEGEQCYTDFYVTEQGFLYYDVGCQPDRVCNVLNSRKRSVPQKRQFNNLNLCEECCDSDYCNAQGCGDKTSLNINRTICYKCDDVINPEDCPTVQVCNEAEECFLTHQLTELLEFRYQMGCRKKDICSIASSSPNFGRPKVNPVLSGFGKKRQDFSLPYDDCTYCCNNNFCNNKVCEHGSSTQIATTVHTPKPTHHHTPTTSTHTHKPPIATPKPTHHHTPTTSTHKATHHPITTPKPTHRPTPTTTPKPTHRPTTTTPKPTHRPTTTTPKTTHRPTTTTPKPTHRPTTTTPKPTHRPTTTTPKPTHRPTTTTPKPTHRPTTTTTPKPTHKPTPTATPAPFSCYDCHYTAHDVDCNHTNTCPSDQQSCYVARVDGSLGNDNCFYRFGCIDIGDCRRYAFYLTQFKDVSFLNNQTIEYIDCCTGPDCNEHKITQRPKGCTEIVN